MPRLAPAAEARAPEPPAWLNRAELIAEFEPGGRTTVSAVYRLGINESAIAAKIAAPITKRKMS